MSLADRDGQIWADGTLVPWREATLHVLSHGLHYGGAVFEGIRVYGGRPFRLAEHLDRLGASARELGFELPYATAVLVEATLEVIRAEGIVDGYIRPVAWRGSEQISVSSRGNTVHVAVAAWEWPHVFTGDAQSLGISLGTSAWRRPAPETAPVRAKASSLYNICSLARDQAEAAGFEDALFLDYRGYLAEATGANLFLVLDGELHTPLPDCFLSGITRKTVLELAERRGIKTVERHIQPAELADAEEIFLTGTAYEVQPVRAVDQYEFPVGPVTSQLRQDYQELVRTDSH